jgi:hypothetical protein
MGLFDSTELNSVPNKSTQQTISGYAQPYVSDLLGKAQAFTGQATPAYTGQLTAGPSYLQEQAWQGLSGLTLPEGLTEAGQNLQNISTKAQNLTFKPVNFTDTYTAPDAYKAINAKNQYDPTAAYKAANIKNTYKAAASGFDPTNVTTGIFTPAQAAKYMNPYIQQALNPQLEALQRQAAINQQGDMAKLAKAGAFGGSRQAILQGQNEYNLLAQQANLIGQGYNQAYTQAGQQFTADQARALEAKKVNVDQAKYAAQLGMTDAQLMAQYGMTAAQANEASRQFAQQQALANAQNKAQFGTTAQAANIQQRQFGATQAMTAAQQDAQAKQAQQAAQQAARQFGATYGLQGLQAATTAQQAAANAGAQEAQYGLANLQALSKAGVDQQNLEQAALNAQYNEYLRQLKYPAEMLKLQRDVLSGLPATTTNEFAPKASIVKSASGAISNVAGMVKDLKASGMTMDNIAKYINKLTATSPAQTGGIKLDEQGNYIYPSSPDGVTPYDDDGNLMPGFGLDENNNPVWVGSDYVEPSYYDSGPDDSGPSDDFSNDYEYTNPDDSPYQDWWETESYD